MAPAFVQALDPASLAALSIPAAVILGNADPVAAPHSNGGVVARAIPRAKLKALPGVGHYDFLSTCSQDGHETLPALCQNVVPQGQTHYASLDMALNLFANALGPP
jgi:predicted dienelactone hydrolase